MFVIEWAKLRTGGNNKHAITINPIPNRTSVELIISPLSIKKIPKNQLSTFEICFISNSNLWLFLLLDS